MRKRFTIRAALLSILVIGVVLGLFAEFWRQRGREELARSAMQAQSDATSQVLEKARGELIPKHTSLIGTNSGGGRSGDEWEQKMCVVLRTGTLFDIEARGSRTKVTIHPIRIVPGKGDADADVIRRLSEEYRKRGWAFQIDSPR